jgi:hypothetical protein
MTPKESPADREVSLIAARDIDGNRLCCECKQMRPVMLLCGADIFFCSQCWRNAEDGANDA